VFAGIRHPPMYELVGEARKASAELGKSGGTTKPSPPVMGLVVIVIK
jgi:hypothetical protein